MWEEPELCACWVCSSVRRRMHGKWKELKDGQWYPSGVRWESCLRSKGCTVWDSAFPLSLTAEAPRGSWDTCSSPPLEATCCSCHSLWGPPWNPVHACFKNLCGFSSQSASPPGPPREGSPGLLPGGGVRGKVRKKPRTWASELPGATDSIRLLLGFACVTYFTISLLFLLFPCLWVYAY